MKHAIGIGHSIPIAYPARMQESLFCFCQHAANCWNVSASFLFFRFQGREFVIWGICSIIYAHQFFLRPAGCGMSSHVYVIDCSGADADTI
jgi:hypothetical protein